ncbi:MAG TPA: hypothetical protein VD794_08850 [Flavisolibacter sp.]|nr:hypothetical protein [Flavisolibacter sp.]
MISCNNESVQPSSTKNQQDKPVDQQPVRAIMKDTLTIQESDSFQLNNVHFTFIPTKQEPIPEFLEAHNIRISGGQRAYFETNANRLLLFLENADTLSLLSNQAKQYSFYCHIPSIDYYLIKETRPEGFAFLLVNRKNGFQQPILGWPYVSPEKEKIFVINQDLIAGHQFNGFQLFSIASGKLVEKATIQVMNWEPEGVMWKDSQTIILKKRYIRPLPDKETLSFDTRFSLVKIKG